MACIVNLLDQALTGEDSGGTLSFDGYDANQDSIFDSGGSAIFIDPDGNVNFDGVVAGDYYFTYSGGLPPECNSSTPFFVRVLEHVDAGESASLFPCNGDAVINLFAALGGTPDTNGTWSGPGTTSPNYSNGGTPNDPTDDTFNPIVNGLYVFTYTVNQITPSGFELVDCENCASDVATITINVQTCGAPCNAGNGSSLSVCASVGCQFDLFDQLGGTPDTGGTWTWLSGPQVITPTNGDNGTVNFLNAAVGVYQFQYTVGTCTAIVTVTVVATPWAGTNGTTSMCESGGSVNLFQYLGGNPNSGGTWSISPGLPAGTFSSNGNLNPAPGDSGPGASAVYVATYTVSNPVNGPCGTVCIDTATVTVTIYENCFAGNNNTIVVCQTGSVVLNPAVLLGATSTGGTWFVFGQSVNCNNSYGAAVFSVNGGPVQNYQGDPVPNNATLDEFATLGCILLQYLCSVPGNPNCNDIAELIIQVINCSPPCSTGVTISAIGCNLSSTITGTPCPGAIYLWQVFSGGNWIPAPGVNNLSTYTGLHNQQYRVRVTGCPNCNEIYSTPLTVSCPPAGCNLACSLVYNTTLQRLEATLTNSGAPANVNYVFNKAANNTPSCNSCTGWGVNLCSGSDPDGAGFFTCSVQQTCEEQCWRFVAFPPGGQCSPTLCCVKIPAIATTKCYVLPDDPQYTEITELRVTPCGGSLTNIMQQAQFGCDEYCNIEPNGTCTGNINCSYVQLVIDINQYLAANGYTGTAYMVQSTKSSKIRIKDTNLPFTSVLTNHGVVNFIQEDTCTAGDTTTYHFQGCDSTVNFSVQLDASAGGSVNLFTYLDLYCEEVPHTGTWAAATSNIGSGCANIVETCYVGGSPPVTINAGTGLMTWVPFVPAGGSTCFWQFSYTVVLPNGQTECFYVEIDFIS